jgi:hypothetical protein
MGAMTPKPKKVKEKPVQYLRNPFLDSLSIGNDAGRNSLRIDLGSPSSSVARPFEGTPTGRSNQKTSSNPLGGIPSTLPGLVIPTRLGRGGAYAQR